MKKVERAGDQGACVCVTSIVMFRYMKRLLSGGQTGFRNRGLLGK